MKLLLILSLLCINNQGVPEKEKGPCKAKKEVKASSYKLAPSIIIVSY